jgi:hypothetical protein
LRRGLDAFPWDFAIAYGTFLASYLGLLAYLYGYRFRRLACPGCSERMLSFVADMDDGTWRHWLGVRQFEGRFYREPLDADDPRPWVRWMKSVRACLRCRTYVDCSRLIEETCTEAELGQLGSSRRPPL